MTATLHLLTSPLVKGLSQLHVPVIFNPLDQYQYQQLPTYPSPNPTLTLTCSQLTVVELGEG